MAMERKTLRKGWLQDKSVIDNFTNPCREVTSEVMSHDVIDDISMVNLCVCLLGQRIVRVSPICLPIIIYPRCEDIRSSAAPAKETTDLYFC